MTQELAVKFDSCDQLTFVQGDMRTVSCVLYNPKTSLLGNLAAGAILSFNFPRQGGGSIKRTTGPTQVTPVQVIIPAGNPGYIGLPDNGLVSGDIVQVAANAGGTLPSPLAPSTNYQVLTIDLDSFYLCDATTGAIIALTTQGTKGFSYTQQGTGIVIENQTTNPGQFTLGLQTYWSQLVNAALAQTPQLIYTDPSGNVEIIRIVNLMDVYAQPVP